MTTRRIIYILLANMIAISTWFGCEPSQSVGFVEIDAGGNGDVIVSQDHYSTPDSVDTSTVDVDAEACTPQCGEDLHKIFDCNGKFVSLCPDGQGCVEGICGDPCASAEVNHSPQGCEYYVAPPAQPSGSLSECFALAISNTWDTDVTIGVDYNGSPLDISGFLRMPPTGGSYPGTYTALPSGKLAPGQIAIAFLAKGTSSGTCPDGVTPAVVGTFQKVDTNFLDTFRVSADRPVNVHEFYPFWGGPTSNGTASLLLPTSSWSTNYIAQMPYPRSTIVSDRNIVQIVAREDGTTVEIQPTGNISGNVDAGISACTKGQYQSYSINKGQGIQFLQSIELSGSTIVASKPVGVWGGATALTIDVAQGTADWAHHQLAPITSLGSAYAAVRYRDRVDGANENTPWRIVGVVDGTNLSYSPKQPTNAPSAINKGEVVTFTFNGSATGEPPFSFVVSSQDDSHPFYMAAYMTGSTNANSYGDPEWVSVVPIAQYMNNYTFFTDPSFPETDLVVVRKKVAGEFKDVSLDCAGKIMDWSTFDSADDLQYARVDLVRNDFVSQNGCSNGTHSMTSDAPFGVTVWGWGAIPGYTASSYAFTAGAASRELNSVIVPIVK